uniref:Uncharacterized protein n=1 Tax=Ciona savignyi TaxID=51511 RepID=H2Y4A4_CIOSA
VKFVETSASLNQNVDGLFEGIISQIHLRAAPSRSKSPSESSASSSGVKSAELLRRFRGSVITTINGIRKLNRLSQSSSDGAPSNSEDREFVDDDDVFTTSKPNDYVEMPETENPGKIRKLIRRLTGKKLTTRQNCQNLSVL